jgi:hypothetical protein
MSGTTKKTLSFVVQKQKMEITVPYPVSVENAAQMYSERGLMEIIARGLAYYYRRSLESAYKETTNDPKYEAWKPEDHIKCAQTIASNFTPPGALPPSQAELQLKAIEEMGERDRAELLGLLGFHQNGKQTTQDAPRDEITPATAEEVAAVFMALPKEEQDVCASYIKEARTALKGGG